MLKRGGIILIGMSMAAVLASCANRTSAEEDKKKSSMELIEQNPDIFGWLIVPDTNIDYPIAQNIDGDDTFYQTHDITGTKSSDKGGIYIESCNMMDMCDFNTVIHGSTNKDGDMFSELWNFSDSEFFKNHEEFMIAIPGNTLTYEVWTAYARDNNDVMEQYDFTESTDCQRYLDDMKKDWNSKTNIRDGWESGLTPDNFLVSLTTVDPDHPDKQWVVVGCLVGDEAGTINREDMGSFEE
ncbi:class B sortase [Butyrivibrio sp. AE3004]|uniref:class B sortase n=1 Tax=Butyrivibrio sp. AE3004 TaxID=1506994 RepID=UPI000AF70461|nr:class B sortase [Butyrivibrio sp. AE3004]